MSETKKSRPSYFYSIISITLVLFILGMIGLIISQANSLTTHFRENLEFTLILEDDVKDKELEKFIKSVESKAYVKSSNYTSKDQAAKRFAEEFDEDFLEILGENPLFASLSIFMKSSYANSDSITWIERELLAKKEVKEVFYQEGLVDLVNANVRKLSLILLLISALFLFMAFTLIDNTIRLAMFSDRFLIKSMQMVGATRAKVTRPFMRRSLINGLVSGLLAVFCLVLLLYFLQNNMPELAKLQTKRNFVAVCVGIMLTGILISFLSTRSAVLKYLKSELDDLY